MRERMNWFVFEVGRGPKSGIRIRKNNICFFYIYIVGKPGGMSYVNRCKKERTTEDQSGHKQGEPPSPK